MEINNQTDWTDEEKRNIVGFFDLLLKIDQRINPKNYKNNSAQEGSGQTVKKVLE